MMKYSLVFFAVLALTQGKALDAQDSIQIQLYYESFCSGCRAFIRNQLHQTYQALGASKIKLEFIPFGWAQETVLANGTKQFACQHGPDECYGNKVHACALALHPIEISEPYIYCLESAGSSADIKILQQCAKDVNISWNDIEGCISNGQGDDLLSAYGKETQAADFLKFVPTVVFDGKYSEEKSLRALQDLKGIICEKLGDVEWCDKK